MYGGNYVEVLGLWVWLCRGTVLSPETPNTHPPCSLLLQGKSVHSRSTDRSCPLRLWCSIRHRERAGSVPRVPSTVSCRRSTHSSSRPMTVVRGLGKQPGKSHTSELSVSRFCPGPSTPIYAIYKLFFKDVQRYAWKAV